MDILKFPLARVTVGFVFGIVVATHLAVPVNLMWIIAALLLLLFSCSYIFANKHFRQRSYFGICVGLVSVSMGMLSKSIDTNSDLATRYSTRISDRDSIHELQIILRERLKNTPKNTRFVGHVTLLDATAATGKIVINIARQNNMPPLAVGSIIKTSASIYKHQPPTNPGQFDYGKYLENKGIFAQLFVEPNQISISETNQKDIWYYSDQLRSTIIKNLEKSHFPASELSVLSALILGQQQDISKQTLQDYQYAGAIHILSVSGLHVGFILLFLTFVLSPLPKSTIASYIKICVIITFLWGFALIAGFSPSVVRSVTMFSFVAIGMHLKRETNIYHTLLVSLLLILLIEPSFLFDVGFQLSYTALFFILWLQPMLSSLWKPRYKIVNYFWDILTVSVAAQIGAFPLSVYYFHQFPGLFFVTNLAIIPFISLIMALGVVTMIIAAFTQVPELLVTVLKTAIWCLNTIVHRVASIENFVIRDISFNFQILLASYIAIILVIASIKQPGYNKSILAMIAILTVQLVSIGSRWRSHIEKELIVFDIRKNSLIAERANGALTVYSDQSAPRAILQPYLTANFLAETDRDRIRNVLYFEGSRILIIDSSAIVPEATPDVIVLLQSPRLNLDRLLQHNRPKMVVADGSNFKSYVRRWEQTCLKAKIPFHHTSEKGFYRIR